MPTNRRSCCCLPVCCHCGWTVFLCLNAAQGGVSLINGALWEGERVSLGTQRHKHVRGSDRVYEPSDRKNEKRRVLSREIRRNPGPEEKVQRRWAIRSFVFLIFVLHDGRSPFFFFLLVFLSMVLQSALWKYSPVGHHWQLIHWLFTWHLTRGVHCCFNPTCASCSPCLM